MRRLLNVLTASMLFLVGMVSSPSALADGATCDDYHDNCEIVIVTPGAPLVDPPGGQPSDPATRPRVPQCSDFSGMVAPVGATLADLGLDDEAHRDWIRITCLSAGERRWLWMEPGVNAEAVARTLLERLQLQPVTIGWTPKRAGSLSIVGVPTWLWVDEPARVTWGPATISAGGVTLTAAVSSMTWSMGNGDEVRCTTRGTEWQRGMGAGPSPSCGYTYVRQGSYRVTATSHWVARWSGYGRSGVIPLSLSQERTLEVGELQVILNR